ncbi:pentapeptide repeat-containing protein [Stigmatella hybrida]|uniref:pentapeptide repeat-containing protein n=1 Tax=Stigmatella hybrida TaxID=394097 RepID=UPI001CDAF815|nr:pentapeptide repeat-containing protein [Stigmatella hybrida]
MPDLKSTKAVGDSFAHRVANTYRELGFIDVQEDVNLAGHAVDIIAKRHTPGIGLITVGIECKTSISNGSRPIGKDQALKWANEVTDLRRAGKIQVATMIASQGFTRQAKEILASNHINSLSFEELTASAIDFTPFTDRYIREYENWGNHPLNGFLIQALASSNLGEIFTQRSAVLDPSGVRTVINDLDEYFVGPKGPDSKFLAKGWVTQRSFDSPRCIALLADFGMGKTSYLLHLTYILCKLWSHDKSWPIPVFVPLGKFPEPSDVKQILANTLFSYGVSLPSIESLLRLVHAGKVIPIFDGVDETLTRGNFSVVRSRFEALGAIAQEDARCIVSCRLALFRNDAEMERARIGYFAKSHGLPGAQSATQGYRAIQLQEFTEKQVETFLRKSNPEGAQVVLNLLKTNESLAELSATPVFLDMISRSAPSLKTKSKIKISSLYEIYADHWIYREDKLNNSLSPKSKLILLEELAYTVGERRPAAMRVGELRDFILTQKESGEVDQEFELEDLDWIEHDMRTCAFLTRDAEGNYGFAHRSFQSYFLARRQFRKLSAAQDPDSVGDAIGDIAIGELVTINLSMVTSHWAFLEEMVSQELIHKALNVCRGATTQNVGYACTNLVSLQMRALRSIEKLDNLPLPSLYCESLDLSRFSFKNCDLSGALFHNCVLDNADFSGANLDGAYIEACWLNDTVFNDSKLDQCKVIPGIRTHAICATKDWVALGGPGGQIQVFKDGKFTRLLRSHGDIVTSLSMSSSKLASGGYADRTVVVTDLASGKELFRKTHRELANIESVHFSPDGEKLFFSEHFGTVFVLETKNWARLWSKKFDQKLECSYLINNQLVLFHMKSVQIINAETGDAVREFDIPEDYGREHAVSQRYLALSYLPSEEATYKVLMLDLSTGNKISEWDCPYGLLVSNLVFCNDRLFIATEQDFTTRIDGDTYRIFHGAIASARAKLKPEEVPAPALYIASLSTGSVKIEAAVNEFVVAMTNFDGSVLAATCDGRVLSISGEDLSHSMLLTAGAFASNLSLDRAKGSREFVAALRINNLGCS